MGAAWAWARSELRRRRGATAALVLLIGLSGAVVLTALAGARRTDTAFARFLDSAHTADVRLQYSSTEPVDEQVLDALRSHPDIEVAQQIYFTLVVAEGSEYDLSVFAGPDPGLFTNVDRPRLLEGRLPDPAAADEVLVNRFTAEKLGLDVGDTLQLASFSPAQLEGDEYEEPAGPTIDVTVVGIDRLPDDVADPEVTGLLGTPAFHDAYWGKAAGFGPSIEILVRPGADPEAAVQAAIEGIAFDEVQMTTREGLGVQVEHGAHAMAVGLAIFAAAAALATLVAASQALHRRVAGAGIDQPTLLAIGLTGPQRFAAAGMVALPAVLGGTILAFGLSTAASPLMPVGAARQAEPHPGVDVDTTVLGLGLTAITASLLLLGALSAWHTTRVTSARNIAFERGAARPRLLTRLLHGGSSAPVHLGLAMALEPGAGRTAVPVRSAIIGSILGVVGVVAALTFGVSMDSLIDAPGRYGWNWTLAPEVEAERFGDLAQVEGVRDIGRLVHRQVVVGGQQMLGIAVEPVQGSPSLTVRRGRMPSTADEVAVGPQTADRLGLELGDVLEAQGSDGPRRLTLVGEVLFPVFDENPFSDGVAVHPDVIEDLAVSDGFEQPIVTFDDGIPTAEAAARLEVVMPDSVSVYAFPSPPPDVANLRAVRSLPPALAAFLFLVAIAAIGHALATSVRRRRRDLGMVRAIGFVRTQVRAAVTVQAATLMAIGVVAGAPLGVATGRVVWRIVAEGLGVEAAPAVPIAMLAALVPVAVLSSLALAALPGRAATRLRPAEALHAE